MMWGVYSQVPDMMSSIALVKAGYQDAAFSGVIGSQVRTHSM